MERTNLSGREYAAVLSYFGAISTVVGCMPILKKRGEIAGVTEDMQVIQQKLDDVLDGILRSVPQKKLEHIRIELANARMYTKIEAYGLDSTSEAYSYIPTVAVNGLLAYLVRQECLLCDKTTVESRKCPYRLLIEKSVPHMVAKEQDGKCRFADIALGESWRTDDEEPD